MSTTLKHSFNSGELAPRAEARVDVQTYASSAKHCENFIPLVSGCVERRRGTRFSNEIKDQTQQARLIPFVFSVEQAYILEFGHKTMRVNRNGGQLDAVRNITNIADNGGGFLRVTTSAKHYFYTGNLVDISNVVGTTEANGANRLITVISPTTFDILAIPFINPYVTGGQVTAPVDIQTPYNASDVMAIKFVQIADVMYLVHPSYVPQVLTRRSNQDWEIIDFENEDGPYLPLNTDTTLTLTPSIAGPGIGTLTASAPLFTVDDIGRVIRLKYTNWGWGVVTAFTSTTVVGFNIVEPLVAATATPNWRLGVWSIRNGYPAAVALTDNRLVFAGVPQFPQRLDYSRPDQYMSFKPSLADGTVNDDHAISVTLLANDVNAIYWLMDNEKGLFAGTAGGEWLVNGTNGPITPSTAQAKRTTTSGCANLQAVRANNAVLFLQKAGRKIYELSFVFQYDNFDNKDLSQLADHMTYTGVVDMVFQRQPNSILWALRTDGVLLGLTYERSEQVYAWHRHFLGGFDDELKTLPGHVESLAVIPASDGSHDQLWAIVRRTINGSTKRYIEFFEDPLDERLDQKTSLFMDSAVSYDGVPVATITELDHLEGQTVQILADGATHEDRVVTGGEITLDGLYSKVSVGFKFKSKLQSSRLELQSDSGSSQGKKKRINSVTFLFYKTLGGKVMRDEEDKTFSNIGARTPDNVMGKAPDIFGTPTPEFRKMQWPGGYDFDAYVTIIQDQPYPITVLSYMPQVTVNEP